MANNFLERKKIDKRYLEGYAKAADGHLCVMVEIAKALGLKPTQTSFPEIMQRIFELREQHCD